MGFADSPSFDRPPTAILPPLCSNLPGATAWGAVNRAVFDRFYVPRPTPIRYLNWKVEVASGNVQVGIVRLSGTDMKDFTRVAHSGVIACPAAAVIRTDLGVTVLTPGDYAAFIWADNTTFSTRWTSGLGLPALRQAGALVVSGGVAATGTFAWDAHYVSCSLEGDV